MSIDWEFVGEIAILLIGLPLMWWLRRPLQNWPPQYEIESLRARVIYRWSAWAFIWSIVIFAVTMLGQRYGLFAPDALLILKVIIGVLFMGSSIPLTWYRMTRKWE